MRAEGRELLLSTSLLLYVLTVFSNSKNYKLTVTTGNASPSLLCSSLFLFNQQTYTPSTVVFDLADRNSVDRAAEEILKCHGQVDVLINNAGISYRGNILDTHISVQRDVMETNYFGPVALTQG